MTDLSDHDVRLLEEMKALVDRYGLSHCDRVLNEIAKTMGKEKEEEGRSQDSPCKVPRLVEIDLNDDDDDLEEGFADLWRAFSFGGTDDKVDILLQGGGSVPMNLLDAFEEYYDSLVVVSVDHQSHHPSHPPRSRFHSLYLDVGNYDVIQNILERKNVIALFQHVEINALQIDPPDYHRTFMSQHVKDLVIDDGLISSFAVHDQLLRKEDLIAMREILQTNQLHSFCEVYSRVVEEEEDDDIMSSDSPNGLLYSLQTHVQRYAERSILRELEIFNFCELFVGSSSLHEEHERQQGFQTAFEVIGTLPNLKSISIGVNDPKSFQSLALGINNLKVADFGFHCQGFEGDDDMNFQSIFDAVLTASKYIKSFRFSMDFSEGSIPVSVTRQIFSSLVLSTSSGLLKINIQHELDFNILTMVVSDDIHWDSTARGQLRRFEFHDGGPEFWETQPALSESGSGYRILLERHPFLYQLGCRTSPDRQFGVSLFDEDILPKVPDGLWPIVLNKALSSHKKTAEEYSAATSFVFQTIQNLIMEGIFMTSHHSQRPTKVAMGGMKKKDLPTSSLSQWKTTTPRSLTKT